MHTKVFACLLVSTLIGVSLSRSVSVSHQGKAVREADEVPMRSFARISRQEWPDDLSDAQKGLVNQFLPHLFTAAENKKEAGKGSWADFGRRQSAED